jgi:hypothetical protein
MVDFCFSERQLHRVKALLRPDNIACLGSGAKAYCAAVSVWAGLGATKCSSRYSKLTGTANLISNYAVGSGAEKWKRT